MRGGKVQILTREALLARGVPQPSGCITIGKPTKSARYWLVKSNHRSMGAHRWMWTLTHGEIPAGMCVLHSCDVTRCINPDHLWLGTQADNMHDRFAKGRDRVNPAANHHPGAPVRPDSIHQRAMAAGLVPRTIQLRVKKGWSLEKALTTPVRTIRRETRRWAVQMDLLTLPTPALAA